VVRLDDEALLLVEGDYDAGLTFVAHDAYEASGWAFSLFYEFTVQLHWEWLPD
jgi:hypothetical protein